MAGCQCFAGLSKLSSPEKDLNRNSSSYVTTRPRDIPAEEYGVRTVPLFVPPLEEARDALRAALAEDYRESSVDIVDCPDLREWRLAQAGLGGKGTLVDVGGEPFNHDKLYNSKVKFDMKKVCASFGRDKAAILGAGACCSAEINGHLGELTVTANLSDGANNSVSARVLEDKSCCAEDYKSLFHGGLMNLHVTDGSDGKVLRVRAKARVGEQRSLSQTLRRGLQVFPDAVGLGGAFKVLKGKVKAHVNPDQCCCPEGYYDEIEMKCTKPFLQFYEGATAMGPDLVCISSMWTKDPVGGALHLRASGEHTHFFSLSGKSESGHYHGDDPTAEPTEEIEYEGYFVCANEMARVRDAVSERWMDWGEKPTVAVLGAGAMGCLFGGLLIEGGLDVTFIDKWQEHVSKINTEGLRLVGVGGDRTLKAKATTDVTKLGTFDIIIVQCKATDTRAAVESAKHLFRKDSVAISFQNGLGNEDVIAEVLGGADRVFGGQTLQGANIEGPGVSRIHTNLVSYIGEWNGGCSQRCGRIARVFSAAGLPTEEDPNMKKKLWMKAIYNCVVSPLSTLTNLTHRDVYCRKDAIPVADAIIKEALQVAAAEGIDISEKEGRECLDKVIASNQANKSSMCNDILAKRKSEIDYINGRILTLARKHGISVPVNQAMAFCVRGVESHYTGE